MAKSQWYSKNEQNLWGQVNSALQDVFGFSQDEMGTIEKNIQGLRDELEGNGTKVSDYLSEFLDDINGYNIEGIGSRSGVFAGISWENSSNIGAHAGSIRAAEHGPAVRTGNPNSIDAKETAGVGSDGKPHKIITNPLSSVPHLTREEASSGQGNGGGKINPDLQKRLEAWKAKKTEAAQDEASKEQARKIAGLPPEQKLTDKDRQEIKDVFTGKSRDDVIADVNASYWQNDAANRSSKFADVSKEWDANPIKPDPIPSGYKKPKAPEVGKTYQERLQKIDNYRNKRVQFETDDESKAANKRLGARVENLKTYASLQAAKDAGVDIYNGSNRSRNNLARNTGVYGEARKQLEGDVAKARNAMTALQNEKTNLQKRYSRIIHTTDKEWDSLTNTQKADKLGISTKRLESMNRATSGRFSGARSMFGRIVDGVRAVGQTIHGDSSSSLSLKKRLSFNYQLNQLGRTIDSADKNKNLGSTLDEMRTRETERGNRAIGAVDKTMEDLRKNNYRSAQIVNDINNGKSARSVSQRRYYKNENKAVKGMADEAADAAKKFGGHGWKSKAGAVAGLLALGAVLGSMMGGHGEQSNAQLYNPNPQPQYAN